MTIDEITKYEEISLANSLKEIYYETVIEEMHEDSLTLLQEIISMVDISIKNQQNLFEKNPEFSYRISSTHDLSRAFLEKYKSAFNKIEKFAYSIDEHFGHIVDIESVVCPYVLYQLGVTDENISFYIGLGMVIANIVCNTLAKNEEKRIEKEEKKQTIFLCISMKHLLEDSKRYIETEESKQQIEQSLDEINKIINGN